MTAKSSYDRGKEAYASRNYDEAIFHFTKAHHEDPEDPIVFAKLGLTYYKARKFTESIKWFKMAVEKCPKEKEYIYGLGVSYLKVGDRQNALKIYDMLKKVHIDKAEEFYKLIYA